MKVKYVTESDLRLINAWLAKNGTAPADHMPRISLIVPGVAAVGIRQCEGGVAIMDSLATNPLVSAKTRHTALESLFDSFFATAQMLGYTRIIGFTKDAGTLERVQRHGFKKLPYAVLSYTREY